jgi:hypothetical protein
LAEIAIHSDSETAIAGYPEGLPLTVRIALGFAIENYSAIAGQDVHPFGIASAEVVCPRVDEPERLLRLVGKEYGMADYLSVKVDIRFGENGHGIKLCWVGHLLFSRY